MAEELPPRTLLPAQPDEVFDRIARLARKLLGVPTALVTLVDRDRQAFPGAVGLPEPWQTERQTPLSHSFCQHVVLTKRALIVPDARLHPVLRTNSAVQELHVIAYAGMPLTNRAGQVIGSLCAIDSVPRDWTDDELTDLADVAELCSSELQRREARLVVDETVRRGQTLIESMPVGYVSYDEDWRVTAANAAGASFAGSTVDALVGNVIWKLFPVTVGSEFDLVARRVATSGVAEVFEYFYPEPLNKWYEVRVVSDPPGISTFSVDVTARHDGYALADEILTAMPVGYLAFDENWRIIGVNAEAARIVDSTEDALLGHVLWDLFTATIGSEFETIFRRVMATGSAEEFEYFYPDPLNRWYEIRVQNIGRGLSALFIDVSARHEVQALLEVRAEHDRSVAQTLQQALLTELPEVDGMGLAARYLTATGTEQVGGDWYDAALQSDGSVTLSIGDVCGHGIDAAAIMGQLRAMLRGFLWDDLGSLADNIARLDEASQAFDDAAMATLIAARIDLPDADGNRTVHWSNAGHPAPIVVYADGTTDVLDVEPELMLGVMSGVERHDHEFDLPPGSTLVVFTDGLVETRTEPLAVGIAKLRATLSRNRTDDLDAFLGAVLNDLVRDTRDDDIAILAIRVDTVRDRVVRAERRPEPVRAFVVRHQE